MRVTPIPCLADNYAYLVACERTKLAAVVDPSESAPVVDAVARAGVTLAAIWCTHHHGDHVGGVEDLLARYGAQVAVYGHESEHERIPRLSHGVPDGGAWSMGDVRVRVRHVPGHTRGALAYVANEAAVFTGDTLFVAGCGRLFEGTPAMMFDAIDGVFAKLPGATEVYPGHEYAQKNLRFAVTVEPGNAAARARLEAVDARRASGEYCVPSTVADELATNPFARVREPEVRAFARAHGADDGDPVAVLAAVRRARDGF